MRSNPATLAKALRILSRDIECEDGVATAVIAEAADVIERGMLTDEEREAVETSFDAMRYAADELGLSQADCDRLVATLRRLLERHFPTPETTPESHSNQSECSVRTR